MVDGSVRWGKTSPSRYNPNEDTVCGDGLTARAAQIARLPGNGSLRERFLDGLVDTPWTAEKKFLLHHDHGNDKASDEVFRLLHAAANYVGFLANQALQAEGETVEACGFALTGRRGTLTRSQEGYRSFSHVTNEGNRSQFTLNETESRIAEKLWLAAEDGTTKVTKSALLKATGKIYANPSKAFSKSGKSFYRAFITCDTKGNYWLDLEKI